MCRSIVLLALLHLLLQQCVGQAVDPRSSANGTRPVKQLPSDMPSTSEIRFYSFEFKQLYLSQHPGTVKIKGEPSKGLRFFVEAKFYAEEAISTAKFEAVDEAGNVIQKVLIQRQPDAGGHPGFYGVMRVPARPFRIVASGKGIDGKTYRLTHERLFRPTNRPKSAILIPQGGPLKKRQQFEQEYMDRMEKGWKETALEMIVMPRTRVANVMYAPYLSKAGNALGVRIEFDIEFSHDGYYNPALRLYPDYKNDGWRGRIEMKPLTGSIEPKPDEAGSPQYQPHLLAYGAGYVYRRGTTYHFTAEYIPDYVIQNETRTKFCIYYQKYRHSPELHADWRAILDDRAPTKYTLYINNANFSGEIEGLHPQGTLLKSFLEEGAKDCGEQQTSRF